MDYQFLFGILATAFVGVIAWMWNNLNTKLERLQVADDALKDKVMEVHLLVAGQYVRNEALDKLSLALFTKLDRIEAALSNKQDKE